MNNLKSKIILIIIVFFGFFLRLWGLDSIHSIQGDEAAITYEAYSILKTGLDSHGKHMPYLIKAWGDYKLPLSIYLNIPSVAVLGMSKLSSRILPMILGTLSIPLIFLVGKWFKDEETGLVSAFLLALSPWHLVYSKTNYELSPYLFFVLGGVYFFTKGFENGKNFSYASLFFGISLHSILKAELFTPLIFLGLTYSFKEKISKKSIILMALIFFICATPTLYFSVTQPNQIFRRYNQVSKEGTDISDILKNYVSYHRISTFLDTTGKTSLSPSPKVHTIQFPIMLYGLGLLISGYRDSKNRFMIFWLLISPLAASMTEYEPNNLQRYVEGFFVIQIISAVGLVHLWKFRGDIGRKLTILLCASIIVSFVLTTTAYFQTGQNDIYNLGFERGWEKVEKIQDEYGKISLLNPDRLTTAFITKMDPKILQSGEYEKINICRIHRGGADGFQCLVKFFPNEKTVFISNSEVVELPIVKLVDKCELNGVWICEINVYDPKTQYNISKTDKPFLLKIKGKPLPEVLTHRLWGYSCSISRK